MQASKSSQGRLLRARVGACDVWVGDMRAVLARLPANSVHLCATSPPYYGLRRFDAPDAVYGGDPDCLHDWSESTYRLGISGGRNQGGRMDDPNGPTYRPVPPSASVMCSRCGAWRGQLGSEPTVEMYVEHLVECFRAVRRVLHPTGTVWLNLGDGYSSGGRATYRSGASDNKGHLAQNDLPRPPQPAGVKPKDLLGVPWMAAFALRSDGWYLRSEIVWAKGRSLEINDAGPGNPMPESVTDRPVRSHEQVFLLSKNLRYFYDAFAVREQGAPASAARYAYGFGDGGAKNSSKRDAGLRLPMAGDREYDGGRNLRDVWCINPRGYKGAHFAVFPDTLVTPMVLAGTSERGCCPACLAPWKRTLSRTRVPTRPALVSKTYLEPPVHPDSPVRSHGGDVCGNRDPARHVTRTETTGWEPSCKCEVEEPIPCTCLDCFGGSGTVGMVANRLGRRSLVIDVSRPYGRLALERLRTDK